MRSWEDRILLNGAYQPPDGNEFLTFKYEDVSYEISKKTTAFEFPNADGTYVQDLGSTGRRFPLRLFFWGANYDLDVKSFEEGLLQRGAGLLEHPMYGFVQVVPFGDIKRRDDLKTAANQCVLEVTFWETTGLSIFDANDDLPSSVQSSLDTFNTAVSEQFENTTSLSTAVEQATLRNEYDVIIKNVKQGLADVADTQDDVRKQFNAVYDSISTGLDVLIRQPLTLAIQTTILLQAPARAAASIKGKLSSYGGLLDQLIDGTAAVAGFDSSISNTFHSKELSAMGVVSGSVVSGVSSEFSTRSEAISSASEVLTQLSELTAWRDENYTSLEQIDTGEAYSALLSAVSSVVGYLVELSFSLSMERRIVLDRNRSVIDLVAELYGEVDDRLDFFINSNELSGSEILELPLGREIVYYI